VRPPGAGPPIRPGSTATSAGAISTAASDSADGSGSAPAPGSVSIATIGAPTSTTVPASA
jgi:hypothetical protein